MNIRLIKEISNLGRDGGMEGWRKAGIYLFP